MTSSVFSTYPVPPLHIFPDTLVKADFLDFLKLYETYGSSREQIIMQHYTETGILGYL